METSIVKIGNSQGVIIPKKILAGFGEIKKFDMQLHDGSIIIKPCFEVNVRETWEAQFKMAINDGIVLEDEVDDIANEFDSSEWTW